MANEVRRYANFIGGLVEDNPLTNIATTLNSAGLASIPSGISSSEHMAIVLDPDGLFGSPEIAWITALTGGASSCTLLRGQEGTGAREHTRDVPWVHPGTALDMEGPFYDNLLTGTAASITISTIPTTGYNDLRISFMGRSDNASTQQALNMQFNGDTGANYDRQALTSSATTVTASEAFAATSIPILAMPAASASANSAGWGEIHIPNYRLSTFYKTASGYGGRKIGTATGNFTNDAVRVGEWRSTAAITSITLLPAAGSFIAGTRVRAYALR